jgi:signal transduction histidine kinase
LPCGRDERLHQQTGQPEGVAQVDKKPPSWFSLEETKMSIVMIVDDSASVRETLTAIFDGQGYQLITARDGDEALQLAGQLLPDVILLDVMMPGMNGYEVCQRLRSTPSLAEVPIIILTALDDRDSRLKAIEAGADDFLSKPIDSQEIRARVRTITRLNRYRTLVEQRENIREMAERLLVAQEQERQRISREIHDDLGQSLTTFMIELRSLQNDSSLDGRNASERLGSLYDQLQEVFVKLRHLAQDLRPQALDTLGLRLAMQSYCNEFNRRTGLPVDFEFDTSLPPLSDVLDITLYRTLQEALTNVAKHAHANHVWVDISHENRIASLTVQDNGRGFLDLDSDSDGIGIVGIRERLSLVGGNLKLKSLPGAGTILSAHIPVGKSALHDGEN